jgi:ADP-ribose pyrophosphatase YjhB (NUDIX family)
MFRLAMTLKALWAPVAFGVAGAVFDADGRVLLVRQTYMRGWRLPAGGVGRGEPPSQALMRELNEEVGYSGGSARFFALYSRKAGWVTNVIALYRVEGGAVSFRPNWEVRAVLFADPHHPPEGTTAATRRRLKELVEGISASEHW